MCCTVLQNNLPCLLELGVTNYRRGPQQSHQAIRQVLQWFIVVHFYTVLGAREGCLSGGWTSGYHSNQVCRCRRHNSCGNVFNRNAAVSELTLQQVLVVTSLRANAAATESLTPLFDRLIHVRSMLWNSSWNFSPYLIIIIIIILIKVFVVRLLLSWRVCRT